MKSINKVILLGNLTKDPEMRFTQSGKAVISFSVATNRAYKNKDGDWIETPEFTNVVFWESSAETINKYCRKGDRFYCEGRLQTRSWEDKQGAKRYTTEVVGDNFVLLGIKRESEDAAPPKENTGKKPDGSEDVSPEEVTLPSDIPF